MVLFSNMFPYQWYSHYQPPFTVCYSLHVLTNVQKNLFQSEEMEISFSIYLEVLTLSLLPIHQSFLWNPPVSHPDTVNKERVLQRSGAALSAPAIITQQHTVPEPRGCIYAIYSHHSFFRFCFVFPSVFPLSFPGLFLRKFVLRDWVGKTRPVDTASGKSKNPVTAGVSFSRNEETWRDESVWCRPCATALGGNRIKGNLQISM